MKIPKFVTKNVLFGCFGVRILKKAIVIFEINTFKLAKPKFREKIKMSKFGTKNDLFPYFGARISKKLLSYFKSAPSNLSNCKIL